MRKCGFTHASRAEIRIFTPRDIIFRTIFLIRAREQRARERLCYARASKRVPRSQSNVSISSSIAPTHITFPKTFSNDPHQLLRWKFFLASMGKNFLACQKKIDWFPTAADKLININNNSIFFENSMISVPSVASWEFTNQISTISVEY